MSGNAKVVNMWALVVGVLSMVGGAVRRCDALIVPEGGTNVKRLRIAKRGNSEMGCLGLRRWSAAERTRRRSRGGGGNRSALWLGGGEDKGGEKSVEELEEDARLVVLSDRRKSIRGTLRSAEALRNFRINNGLVSEIDEDTGKPVSSDSKAALTLTAFAVAAGAVTLRVGGRAALVSAVGMDFAAENPELKDNMEAFLAYASGLPPLTEGLLFVAAWTAVKVLCLDFGGVVLALSSGLLFGGVLQGAVASAAAATVGSSVAFLLAKADTPLRKKALDAVDQYPSLRGIERVVAKDGLKAILTLRLAPLLPIPIGMYNYVYGVTNVPFLDFAGGIFLGSLKPYLLDSYLGLFGKQVVDGTLGEPGGVQDLILLVALGLSVLIGVFASQLAGETWESVTAELEAQSQLDAHLQDPDRPDDGIARTLMGLDLPLWLVGMQLSLQAASHRIEDMVQAEYDARVWNYTSTEQLPIPDHIDPAKANDSPERTNVGAGFDFATSICEGFVLSPCLLTSFLKYADPLYTPDADQTILSQQTNVLPATTTIPQTQIDDTPIQQTQTTPIPNDSITPQEENKVLFNILSTLRNSTQTKLQQLDNDIKSL